MSKQSLINEIFMSDVSFFLLLKESIVVLFQMLGESIQKMSKEDVVAYTQSLVDIFTVALEYRTNKKRVIV